MAKIGRNEPCHCGSGKKFKSCCLNADKINDFLDWRTNAAKVLQDTDTGKQVQDLFFGMLKHIKNKHWMGACHASSCVLYILFRELGIHADVCIGQVRYENKYFDHSWVEIEGEIYDVSIYLTLAGNMMYPPIIKSINIHSLEKADALYGCNSPYGFDAAAKRISQISIVDYMDNFPESKNGLWDLVESLGQKVNLPIDIFTIRQKYINSKWTIKPDKT